MDCLSCHSINNKIKKKMPRSYKKKSKSKKSKRRSPKYRRLSPTAFFKKIDALERKGTAKAMRQRQSILESYL